MQGGNSGYTPKGLERLPKHPLSTASNRSAYGFVMCLMGRSIQTAVLADPLFHEGGEKES